MNCYQLEEALADPRLRDNAIVYIDRGSFHMDHPIIRYFRPSEAEVDSNGDLRLS